MPIVVWFLINSQNMHIGDRFVKNLAMLAALVLLTGCGIPPAISIATYALDGAVLAASGKTFRDHALSTVAEQDCSLFHVISGKPICVEYEPSAAAAIALAAMPATEAHLLTTSDGRVIRVASGNPAQIADRHVADQVTPPAAAEPIAVRWLPPEFVIAQ